MTYPTDGTSAIPDATAIVKGTKHLENAQLFLDFTVSQDAQRLVEEAFLRRTVRLKAIDYDVTWAASEKESILAAWDALQRSKDEKVD